MTLFIACIPFMIVAVAVAVVPLIAVSRKERRHIAFEFEHSECRRVAISSTITTTRASAPPLARAGLIAGVSPS